ncbi:MAG: DeoR/GlpR family DNA-binding transcription regulator [Treponema sp.]|jgi:DeoR family transcriptional regulator of aga operon/DeoR family fructose operon transcriptional repressor|nr:DeoR/GlpR family DNA-binding transcription regulator [Treponema sp.]
MKNKDFTEERQQKIIEHINRKGRVKVEELSGFFNVTEMTIRRDLLALEKQELLYRAHGGAIKREKRSIWQMSSLQTRLCQNEEEKERIAQCVAQMILDGESIMIDGGSTTTKVAQQLTGKRNLLIVTNTLTIGELLVELEDSKVILTGGELFKETNALMGNATESAISNYRADKSIIGVSGLVPGEGCFSAIPQEAEIKNRMLQNSQKKIVVADSSKIGTRAFYFFCDFSKIDILVTDCNIKKNDLTLLRKTGIDVIVV